MKKPLTPRQQELIEEFGRSVVGQVILAEPTSIDMISTLLNYNSSLAKATKMAFQYILVLEAMLKEHDLLPVEFRESSEFRRMMDIVKHECEGLAKLLEMPPKPN
jgi:hypothetical protein